MLSIMAKTELTERNNTIKGAKHSREVMSKKPLILIQNNYDEFDK